MSFPDFRLAPNQGGRPDLYELENRAIDPDGLVLQAMRQLAPWAGRTLVDLGGGSGYWLPGYAAEDSAALGGGPAGPGSTWGAAAGPGCPAMPQKRARPSGGSRTRLCSPWPGRGSNAPGSWPGRPRSQPDRGDEPMGVRVTERLGGCARARVPRRGGRALAGGSSGGAGAQLRVRAVRGEAGLSRGSFGRKRQLRLGRRVTGRRGCALLGA